MWDLSQNRDMRATKVVQSCIDNLPGTRDLPFGKILQFPHIEKRARSSLRKKLCPSKIQVYCPSLIVSRVDCTCSVERGCEFCVVDVGNVVPRSRRVKDAGSLAGSMTPACCRARQSFPIITCHRAKTLIKFMSAKWPGSFGRGEVIRTYYWQ